MIYNWSKHLYNAYNFTKHISIDHYFQSWNNSLDGDHAGSQNFKGLELSIWIRWHRYFSCPSSLNTNINHENSTGDNQRKTLKSGERAVNQCGIPRLQKPKSSRVFYIPTRNRRRQPRLALLCHNAATEGRPDSHIPPPTKQESLCNSRGRSIGNPANSKHQEKRCFLPHLAWDCFLASKIQRQVGKTGSQPEQAAQFEPKLFSLAQRCRDRKECWGQGNQ